MEENIKILEQKEEQKKEKLSGLEEPASKFSQKCCEGALKAYEEILKVDPKNSSALCGRTDMLYSLRRYSEALESCEAYLSTLSADDKDVAVLQKYADLLCILKRHEEGMVIYKAVLAIEPSNTEILNKYGNGFYFLKRYEEALKIYQSVLDIDSKNVSAYMNRGAVFQCLDNHLEALINFEAALAINPKHPVARERRLKMLEYLGTRATMYKIVIQFDSEENKSSQSILIADFKDHVLDTAHANILAGYLAKHPTLTYLYVDRSELKDAGIAALAEALSQNFHLTTLTFKDNPNLTSASEPFKAQIQAYLHRNHLLTLASNSPSLKELHDFDFSILKGDDFHRVLKRHPNMSNWDFSSKGLTSNTVLLQPHYLPHYPALRMLKLSNNQLGDEGVRLLAFLLRMEQSPLSGLRALGLANNRIGLGGFWFLGEVVSCPRVALQMLDLRRNIIQMTRDDWSTIRLMFLKNKKLEEVKLSGNALPEAIDNSLLEEKETGKSSKKIHRQKVTFFRSQPITIESAIDPTKKIYPEWVIALGCRQDDKQISLYLEGMRASGQRFLYRYALKEGDPTAKVEIYELNVGSFINARKNYTFHSFTVSKTQGEQLQRHIYTQQRLHVQASLSEFFDLASGTLNYFLWCQTQLHSIDLDVSDVLFPHDVDQNSYN